MHHLVSVVESQLYLLARLGVQNFRVELQPGLDPDPYLFSPLPQAGCKAATMATSMARLKNRRKFANTNTLNPLLEHTIQQKTNQIQASRAKRKPK